MKINPSQTKLAFNGYIDGSTKGLERIISPRVRDLVEVAPDEFSLIIGPKTKSGYRIISTRYFLGLFNFRVFNKLKAKESQIKPRHIINLVKSGVKAFKDSLKIV